MRLMAANELVARLLLVAALVAVAALLLLPGCDEGKLSDWPPSNQLAQDEVGCMRCSSVR